MFIGVDQLNLGIGYLTNTVKLFGVKEAFTAAPATLVGFTDMFILALLLGGISSVKNKFIVGVLSLMQIIYLTEVGTIIIKSEIQLNLWKLFLIFMERTLIAILLIQKNVERNFTNVFESKPFRDSSAWRCN